MKWRLIFFRPGAKRRVQTLFFTPFCVKSRFFRKSQNSDFAKFKISNLHYRYCPNFLSVCFPMFEVNKKIKFKTLGRHFGSVKKQACVFRLFPLFFAFKCEVFEITLSSYHSFWCLSNSKCSILLYFCYIFNRSENMDGNVRK